MTDKSTGFSHITANAADDDVVIVAGSAERPAPAAQQAPSASRDDGASAQKPAPEAPARRRAPHPEEGKGASAQRRSAARKRDEYHETTLEDLESTKMSAAQKAIIALCLVGIVVAVAYYLLVIR